MSAEKYALLRTFRSLFEGKPYLHRKSNLGDLVASQLYEDLVAINKSGKLVEHVQHHERVVNMRNVMTGRPGRGKWGGEENGVKSKHLTFSSRTRMLVVRPVVELLEHLFVLLLAVFGDPPRRVNWGLSSD